MGVLNLTPDSFADGGRWTDPAKAVDAALAMEASGADLIDIGGESTRPGAEPLPVEEELARVLPVVRALAGRLKVPVSIDTYKSEVARASLDEGAAIVNDISGLRYDAALAQVVAESRAALVVMHTRGRSREMYRTAVYHDLLREVADELESSLAAAVAAGVSREAVILDPGIGFAKRAGHSYQVLARLDAFASLDRPLLVGPSRKSFLTRALGKSSPGERDWGTAAAVTAAVLMGAHIVRVHGVGEMVQVVKVADEIRRHASELPS
jgi:dihydropteroate synthase